MRFVETVFGEFGAGIEDGLRRRGRNAASLRPFEEAAALRVHLGLDLLSHGAAQEIGFREAVAGGVARRLLDLLLIRAETEGLAQKRLELGVENLDTLTPKLARAIDRNIGHRAWPVEGDEGDEILDRKSV